MTKNYYKYDYTDEQWKALIDRAYDFRCTITYSKYGNIAAIDSTQTETNLIQHPPIEKQSMTRKNWADHIHGQLAKVAEKIITKK